MTSPHDINRLKQILKTDQMNTKDNRKISSVRIRDKFLLKKVLFFCRVEAASNQICMKSFE